MTLLASPRSVTASRCEHLSGRRTCRSRSEAGLIRCWNKTLSARFCCSRSNTRVRSFRHSSLRSCRCGSNTGGRQEHLINARFHRLDKKKSSETNKPSGWEAPAQLDWQPKWERETEQGVIEGNLAILAERYGLLDPVWPSQAPVGLLYAANAALSHPIYTYDEIIWAQLSKIAQYIP